MITPLHNAMTALDPRFQELERIAATQASAAQMSSVQFAGNTAPMDTVSLRAPHLLTDEEAAAAMSSVQQATQESPSTALGLHQGLNYDRVMKLLEGL